jgi:flagellar basal body-associated protein FliL
MHPQVPVVHHRGILEHGEAWHRRNVPQSQREVSPALRQRVPVPIQQSNECGYFRRSDKRMLKMFVQAAAIAVIAFVVAIFVLQFWHSYKEQHQTNHQTSGKEANKEPDNAATTERTEEAIARYTLWLMVFTGVLALVSVVQIAFLINADRNTERAANAAEKSAKVSEDTLKISQRAWVGVQNVFFKPTPKIGDQFGVMIHFKNVGTTPATNIQAQAVFDPVPPDRQPNFDYSKERLHSFGFMMPAADMHFPLIQEKPLSVAGVDALKTGAIRIFVHGRFSYDDIFGESHWFTFCYELVKLATPDGDAIFGPTAYHNDTGDTPRKK